MVTLGFENSIAGVRTDYTLSVEEAAAAAAAAETAEAVSCQAETVAADCC